VSAPGPAGLPVIGHLHLWRKDPVKLMLEAARHGDVVRIDLVQPIHVLIHPDHVKHVLQDHHANYQKGWAFARLRPYWGEGLMTSEGEFWLRQRRLAQPAFRRDLVAGFAPIMVRRTQEMLDRWQPYVGSGRPLNLLDEFTRLTLGIIGETLFGIDLDQDAAAFGRAAQEAIRVVMDRTASLVVLPLALPLPSHRRFRSAMATVDGLLYRLIAEKRRADGGGRDLLSLLIAARDEETGAQMSDQQLRDEGVTMLQNGHDALAEMLAWTWYALSRFPAIERRLHAEVRAALDDRAPTVDDLAKLPYTNMVLQESLRLYPPAWLMPRQAIQADRIGGHEIPAGGSVLLSPFLTQRDPRFWRNPEGFDPERFEPERMEKRPRFAYFPFGGGPRLCIGKDFAMIEANLITAMVARRYRLDLVSGHQEDYECQVDLRPRYGVPVTVHQQL
jgi:cytochrome P450